MVNLDGIQYLFTVPMGLVVGLVVALIIALFAGATWWLIVPPALGAAAGIALGARM